MDGPVHLRDLIADIERTHPDDSLDRLAAAVIHAAHRLRVADRLLDYFVGQARHAGAPWVEIGAHLGVSRQAAQQRFATRVAGRRTVTARPWRAESW